MPGSGTQIVNKGASEIGPIGTCPACMNRHKLTRSATLVAHGFKISDGHGHFLGHRSGCCPGAGFPPFEVSKAGVESYLTHLEGQKAAAQKRLREYRSGTVVEIHQQVRTWQHGAWVTGLRTVGLLDPNFQTVLHYEIASTEFQIDQLTVEINRHAFLLHTWRPQPLKK
jgi:hypothetical protein